MNDYDFRALNDKEFEVLVVDVLSKRDGRKYERFKPGRDSGVDGRYFNADGKEVILQCKHWPSSPLERLIRHMVDVELPKIQKLKPARYVLAISHALSRNDKAQIAGALSPYVITPSDVLGREDLNGLLSENSEVEIKHYKLWISSSNVLRYLIGKPIKDRSDFSLQEIRESSRLYVATANHPRALEKLERLGVVIITGPAGIGKTTLADHLAVHYVTKGFSFIRISDEIREAEAAFQVGESQIFYFDDFLGRNYLEALTGHEGSHIVQFIRRISRDKSKRFILTSRTTILNQGKLLIDVFQENNLERNEFEVSFDSFSEFDKARILYNHIWHSSLQSQYVDELYADKRYRKIISHRNYNPRLIRYITDSNRLDHCPSNGYWEYASDLLENPSKVWEHPFDAQHDDFGRSLILLVTLNARSIPQGELVEAYMRFIAHPDSRSMQGRRDFLQALRHLVGSMLTRVVAGESEPGINLFNPSIGDFVLRRYALDVPSLRAGFGSLRSGSSLKTLLDLESNKLISTSTKTAVLTSILDAANLVGYVGYSSEYIALALASYASPQGELPVIEVRVVSAAKFVAESECPWSFLYAARIVQWCLTHSLTSETNVADFVRAACALDANSDELYELSELVQKLPKELATQLWPIIESAAARYFSEAIYDEFSDDDVFSSVDPENMHDARYNLSSLVEAKLENIGIPISDSIVESIVESFDFHERGNEYFKPEPDYDYRDEPRVFSMPIDAIDDLFDRSR